MNVLKTNTFPSGSLARPALGALGQFLRSRRGLIILAVLALGFGAAFNWSWLVAAGVAPLLLSVLPCAAMCGLGLCMNRMCGRSSGSTSASAPSDPAAPSASLRSAGATCCSSESSSDRPGSNAPQR